jgi:integrase
MVFVVSIATRYDNRRPVMARTVKHAKLDSFTARSKLKKGRQPHWEALHAGTHLGYQRQKGTTFGRWLLRRYLGQGNKYRVTPLGLVDDAQKADGVKILSHDQAEAKARAMVATPNGDKIQNITVRQAFARYVEWKRNLGQSVADVMSRGTAHILPPLGDLVVSQLTAELLRKWLSTMAASPAMIRPKNGKVQYRPEGAAAASDEAIRKRRATANRVLTMLKAILNHAFDDEQVNNRDAWGRRLKPFKDVDAARVRYLEIAEAKRLINGCEPDFRFLVRAALETGARYSELARLEVVDFNSDSGTVAIRKSKTSKARHIILTDEGAAFFKAHCTGRAGSELMFHRDDEEKSAWKKSDQALPMKEAVSRAKIKPTIGFHGLRHTWASHAVMNGVPLMIVAKNLGHKDTRQVERTYGHLAPSFVVDAIRAGAPKFGIKPDKKVVSLR